MASLQEGTARAQQGGLSLRGALLCDFQGTEPHQIMPPPRTEVGWGQQAGWPSYPETPASRPGSSREDDQCLAALGPSSPTS